MIDISKINLNLLISLDALLTEGHVTRAANKLNVSQAAMSASLKQLRGLYQDALLVRGHQGQMVLTPFAERLRKKVQLAMDCLQNVLSGAEGFNPKDSRRVFHIGMSDYIAFVILPKLIAYLGQHAPHTQVIHSAINFMDSSDPFDKQNCDLVLGDFPNAPVSLKSQGLFKDEGVVVADKRHQIFKHDKITLELIAKYPQVFVSLEGEPRKNFILEYMRKKYKDVSVALFTPHTLISLFSLPNTDHIAHSVTKLATPFLKYMGLAMKIAPYKFPKYHARQYWHIKMHEDPGHSWLRSVIQSICQDLS